MEGSGEKEGLCTNLLFFFFFFQLSTTFSKSTIRRHTRGSTRESVTTCSTTMLCFMGSSKILTRRQTKSSHVLITTLKKRDLNFIGVVNLFKLKLMIDR